METRHHNYSKFSVRIDCNIFTPPSPPKKEKIFRFNSDFLLLTIFFFLIEARKDFLSFRVFILYCVRVDDFHCRRVTLDNNRELITRGHI